MYHRYILKMQVSHLLDPMDVESEWIGAIKQSLEGSSDHSPQS